MSDQKNKRNYIRRKKYLNDSVTQICNTLRIIRDALHEGTADLEIQKRALNHAQAIEAACWSPHSRITEEDYKCIMMAKTRELCFALAKQKVPSIDTIKPQPHNLSNYKRSISPQVFTIPRSAPTIHRTLDEPKPNSIDFAPFSFEADQFNEFEGRTNNPLTDFSDGDIFSNPSLREIGDSTDNSFNFLR